MDLGLAGLSGVVIGAARGLGAAIVETLLRESASVVAVSRSRVALESAHARWRHEFPQQQVRALSLDMSEDTSIDALAKSLSSPEKVDFLVVSAGSGRAAEGSSYRRFLDMASRNVAPCLNSVDALTDRVMQSAVGSILFVSSISSTDRIDCPSEYAAAKRTLDAYASHLAVALAPVRVNVLAPGNLKTEGSIWQKMGADAPSTLESYLEENVPLRRIGEPAELARLAAFMVSPACSFMTGTKVVADGGQVRGLR